MWVLKNKLVLYYYYAKNSHNLVSKTAGISSHLAFCLVNLSMQFCAFCFLNTMMFTGPTGMKGHPLLRVQRAGVDYALRLSLSVQQDQYYGSLRDSSGFKVMVHDQEEPPLINELGFAIQPGTHTFCGLRKEVVCTWIVSETAVIHNRKSQNKSLTRGGGCIRNERLPISVFVVVVVVVVFAVVS